MYHLNTFVPNLFSSFEAPTTANWVEVSNNFWAACVAAMRRCTWLGDIYGSGSVQGGTLETGEAGGGSTLAPTVGAQTCEQEVCPVLIMGNSWNILCVVLSREML